MASLVKEGKHKCLACFAVNTSRNSTTNPTQSWMQIRAIPGDFCSDLFAVLESWLIDGFNPKEERGVWVMEEGLWTVT